MWTRTMKPTWVSDMPGHRFGSPGGGGAGRRVENRRVSAIIAAESYTAPFGVPVVPLV